MKAVTVVASCYLASLANGRLPPTIRDTDEFRNPLAWTAGLLASPIAENLGVHGSADDFFDSGYPSERSWLPRFDRSYEYSPFGSGRVSVDRCLPLNEILEDPPDGGSIQLDGRGRLQYTNWPQTVQVPLSGYLTPKTTAEVQGVVKWAVLSNATLRVIGSGHSCAPLAAFGNKEKRLHVMVSLEKMKKGVEKIDEGRLVAEVWAGTTLRDLGRELWDLGYSMVNLPNIDKQTIAGAVSTSTHGTGGGYGTLSSQVMGMTLIDGMGDIVEVSEKDSDLGGYRQSLGLLGVIVKIKLRVVPKKMVEAQSREQLTSEVMGGLEMFFRQGEYVEAYIVLGNPFAAVSVVNPTTRPKTADDVLRQSADLDKQYRAVTRAVLDLGRAEASLLPAVSGTLGLLTGRKRNSTAVVNAAHLVLVKRQAHEYRYAEMEYFVPLQLAAAAFEALEKEWASRRYVVSLGVRLRVLKAEENDVWLSPASSVPSPYIAPRRLQGPVTHVVAISVAEYRDMRAQGFLSPGPVEEILLAHGGRPHNAKLHRHFAARLRSLEAAMPRVGDFLRLRRRRDPRGVFLNEWLNAELLVDEFEKEQQPRT